MKQILVLAFSLLFFSCKGQENSSPVSERKVGGPCEGCEAIFEYGIREIKSVDTLTGFSENEPKMKITGTVYQADGRTPASNILIYIYHTNREGIYATHGGEKGWARRHGIHRGWVRSADDGSYTFYTFRPASYPNRNEPEHIHFIIKEPGYSPYYIDDIRFTDDPLLGARHQNNSRNRGGSGIINLKTENNLLIANRDIVLGENVPGYN